MTAPLTLRDAIHRLSDCVAAVNAARARVQEAGRDVRFKITEDGRLRATIAAEEAAA